MKYGSLKHTQQAIVMILIGLPLFVFIESVAAGNDIWLERLDDEIIRETRNDSMWRLDRSKRLRSEQEVERYLDQLNSKHYKDWRLPTKSELHRFIEIFDWKKNGEVKIKIEGDHWLIDDSNKIKAGEWELDDLCGPIRVYYNKKSGYVRAVRP